MKKKSLCLAIESATSRASVALFRGSTLLAERRIADGRQHCESLLPTLDRLLADEGCGVLEIDAFAISIGPGAFTSLRIGLATLKGLAFESGHPVVAVSTLRVLALSALDQNPDARAEIVVPVLNAQRGEVYAAAYRVSELVADPESAEALVPESVYGPDELSGLLPSGGWLVGEGVSVLGSLLCGGPAQASWIPESEPFTAPGARSVGKLGLIALGAGRTQLAEELVPRYLRRAEAEVTRDGRRLE